MEFFSKFIAAKPAQASLSILLVGLFALALPASAQETMPATLPVAGSDEAESAPLAEGNEDASDKTEAGPIELSPEEIAEQARLTAELELRLRAIGELESELGIYDPSLAEAYGELAQVYEQLDDPSNAVQIYSNALQITRIANGLDSAEQLAVINSLIENNSRLDEWHEVDDLQHLSYHLNVRNFNPEDPAYLQNLTQFANWKLKVLRENLLKQSSSGLLQTATDLSNFYEEKIELLESVAVAPSRELLSFYFGRATNDLELVRAVARTPSDYFQGTASRYITQTRCYNVRNASGQVERQCQQVRVENPRFRSSQRNAKNFELTRRSMAVRRSLEQIVEVANALDLSGDEKMALEAQLRVLDSALQGLRRGSSRVSPNAARLLF